VGHQLELADDGLAPDELDELDEELDEELGATGDPLADGVAMSSPAHWPSSATTGTSRLAVSPSSNWKEIVTN
jgi:hypothetical protein